MNNSTRKHEGQTVPWFRPIGMVETEDRVSLTVSPAPFDAIIRNSYFAGTRSVTFTQFSLLSGSGFIRFHSDSKENNFFFKSPQTKLDLFWIKSRDANINKSSKILNFLRSKFVKTMKKFIADQPLDDIPERIGSRGCRVDSSANGPMLCCNDLLRDQWFWSQAYLVLYIIRKILNNINYNEAWKQQRFTQSKWSLYFSTTHKKYLTFYSFIKWM